MYSITNVVNIVHNIFGLSALVFVETLFANIYFLTIFYYIGYNVLTLRWTRIILHCTYAFFVVFETAVLLEKIITSS